MKAVLQFSDYASSARHPRRYRKMKAAFFAIEPRADLSRQSSQIGRLAHWQEELHYWQLEATFFHSLLNMGMDNCKPDSWHRLDLLPHAFSVYEHEILPDMKSCIENILSDTHIRNGLQIKILLREIEVHAEALKKLKIEVFPYLSELLYTPIW